MMYENEMKNLCPGHCAQQSLLSQINSCLLLYTLTWDGDSEASSTEIGTTTHKYPGQDICWFFLHPVLLSVVESFRDIEGKRPRCLQPFLEKLRDSHTEGNKLGGDDTFLGPPFSCLHFLTLFIVFFPIFIQLYLCCNINTPGHWGCAGERGLHQMGVIKRAHVCGYN